MLKVTAHFASLSLQWQAELSSSLGFGHVINCPEPPKLDVVRMLLVVASHSLSKVYFSGLFSLCTRFKLATASLWRAAGIEK